MPVTISAPGSSTAIGASRVRSGPSSRPASAAPKMLQPIAKAATTGSSVSSSGERGGQLDQDRDEDRAHQRGGDVGRRGLQDQRDAGRRPAAGPRPPPSAGTRGGWVRTARSASIAACGPSSRARTLLADRGDGRGLVEAQRRADGLEARRIVVAERDEEAGRRGRALHVRLAERGAEPAQLGLDLVHRAPTGQRRDAEQEKAPAACAARLHAASVLTSSASRPAWRGTPGRPTARTRHARRSPGSRPAAAIAHVCSSTTTAAAVPGGIAAAAS